MGDDEGWTNSDPVNSQMPNDNTEDHNGEQYTWHGINNNAQYHYDAQGNQYQQWPQWEGSNNHYDGGDGCADDNETHNNREEGGGEAQYGDHYHNGNHYEVTGEDTNYGSGDHCQGGDHYEATGEGNDYGGGDNGDVGGCGFDDGDFDEDGNIGDGNFDGGGFDDDQYDGEHCEEDEWEYEDDYDWD